VPAELGADALLAITIDRAAPAPRYQGLVPLVGNDFAAAFEAYFDQSEQLPTALKLCATPTRCAGLLLQQVAKDGGEPQRAPSEAFEQVRAAAAELGADALLEQPAEQTLIETFPEQAVRVFEGVPLEFRCRCSRERVAAVLRSLGREEAQAALAESAVVEVTCEFCGHSYRFDGVDVAQIYQGDNAVPGPDTRQ
jgi:molecular chaperone Hsp33